VHRDINPENIMNAYAEYLRKWLAFDGPAPADAQLRLDYALARGHITPEEYRVLWDTPLARMPINASGGSS
jgi:hypothetical protein